MITQRLQAKIIELKRYFKEKEVSLKNFSLNGDTITFEAQEQDLEQVSKLLKDKESDINQYYQSYKSHEFDVIENNNLFNLNYSWVVFI